MTQSKS